MATCYRHPSRETGVSCSNCGNPICPDCMTATPVGMRCPDCAGQRQKVHTMRSMHVDPYVTYALIGICVVLYLASGRGIGGGGGSQVFVDFALFGPLVAEGEYWRLITGGFLHSGLIHLAFNMYLLYWLGSMLEPRLGHVRFLALYLASLLAGSFGVMVLSPESVTVGASGAVFGIAAAIFVMERARGVDFMQSQVGLLLAFNLVITFIPGFNISIGGHLGGLIGGAIAGFAIDRLPGKSIVPAVAACVALGAAAAAGAIALA